MNFLINLDELSDELRIKLADETTNSSLLDELSKDKCEKVLYVVAQKHTNQIILDDFSKSKDPKLRASTAHNPKIRKDIIERLSKDPNPDVRRAISITNYEQPHREIIKKLAKDPDPEVRFALSLQGMFKIEEDEEILGILLDSSPEGKVNFSYRSEPSPKNVIIRYHIARVTKDLEKLETLSQDFDWATRYSVISNPKTSTELIKKMQLQLKEEIERYYNLNPEAWEIYSGYGTLNYHLSYLATAITLKLKYGYIPIWYGAGD